MERGGSQEEVLSLNAQLVKARGDREAAQRSLDFAQTATEAGFASAGEVREPKTRWHKPSPAQPHSTEANQALLPSLSSARRGPARRGSSGYDAAAGHSRQVQCARAV